MCEMSWEEGHRKETVVNCLCMAYTLPRLRPIDDETNDDGMCGNYTKKNLFLYLGSCLKDGFMK